MAAAVAKDEGASSRRLEADHSRAGITGEALADDQEIARSLGGTLALSSGSFTNLAGFASTPLPIPTTPGRAGFTLYGQHLVFDPDGQFLGFAQSTLGLAITPNRCGGAIGRARRHRRLEAWLSWWPSRLPATLPHAQAPSRPRHLLAARRRLRGATARRT